MRAFINREGIDFSDAQNMQAVQFLQNLWIISEYWIDFQVCQQSSIMMELLSVHMACLCVATPIDQLPLIDAQLSQSHHILRSYAHNHTQSFSHHERQELDNFLGMYEDSIRYYVRALAMNPKADNAWQYLRISLSCASRHDMLEACDSRNLDILQKEFPLI